MVPYAYDSFNMLIQGFESGRDVLQPPRLTSYNGTAGMITEAGRGNFRCTGSLGHRNGQPLLAEHASRA